MSSATRSQQLPRSVSELFAEIDAARGDDELLLDREHEPAIEREWDVMAAGLAIEDWATDL